MQFRNIIFDLGGVIIKIKSESEWFKELSFVIHKNGLESLRKEGFFDEFELGNISNEEFLFQLLQYRVQEETSFTQLITAWNSILLDFNTYNVNRIIALKRNHNIFLLSNTNSIHEEEFIRIGVKQFGYDIMSSIFNQNYYSHKIGYRKPILEAYNLILKEQNIDPKETLFIDDKIENINAASSLGINTIHHSFNTRLKF